MTELDSLDELGAEKRRPHAKANLFFAVLNTMTDGVMVVDDRLRVVVTNRALRELLILPPASEGQALSRVLPDARLRDAFQKALDGDPARNIELEHRGLQRRTFDVLVTHLPDHEVWGHRALAVFRDVTERRALEQVLRDFIANASHELRTPVTAILGYAETLVDLPPKDIKSLKKFTDPLFRHALRLTTLVNRLLDLSRLDARTWQLDLQPVEVGPLVQTVLEGLREASVDAGLSVSVHVPAKLPKVLADSGALDIVLGNLVQNAIKYTPPGGGRIEVRAREVEAQGPFPVSVAIAVIDSGIGINADDQARVFERFYRVDPGRSRRMGGVGLGLSLVRELVQAMDGRIELSSQIGQGSRFTVLLPAVK